MGYILEIDTATHVCSVALSKGEQLLGFRESKEANVHSRLLTVFIKELMEELGVGYTQLDAVAVSMGPGSYTGLRIGVSAAKGFCYGLEIPLMGIPTLRSMAAGAITAFQDFLEIDKHTLLCPMIDAKRMEVYTALFTTNLEQIMETNAIIIDKNSFSPGIDSNNIYFFGNGAAKTKPILEEKPNAHYPEGFEVSARHMVKLALEKYQKKDFEDVAYFEPFYLKDFIAGKPRVKGL